MPDDNSPRHCPSRTQRGQVLPLGLALILIGALGGFVLYNSGQSATDKARLVNAADAAAYSGAQWQARALNFQAYTNRAMVANQVTLAQAVTLESWTTYGQIMSENLATVLQGVPYVNAIASGVETVMTTINQVVSPIAGAMLRVIDTINAGIGYSQKAMFASTFVATPAVVKGVVEASDERFSAETAYGVLGALSNLRDWYDFTDNVGKQEDDYVHMRERAELIRQSQDEFTRNRDWDFFGGYLYIAPGVKIEIVKEGRTGLIEREGDDGLEWEWKAKDTLSFHTKINLLFRKDHIEMPIGYGGAFANNADEGDETIEEGVCRSYFRWGGHCARMLDENETSEGLVDRNTPSLRNTDSLVDMNGYSGLREFRRLSDSTREEAFPTLRLRVEAAMPLSGTDSTARLTRADPFDTPLVARGDKASSISIAEAYFKPPDADAWIADDPLEFANAYSPFWNVRLAPVPVEERLAAFLLRKSGDSVPEAGEARAPGNRYAPSDGDASPELATLFANGTGADARLVGGLVRGSPVEAAGTMAEAVAREYADELMSDAVDGIKANLQDKLEQAVDEIMNGIARDVAASYVGEENLELAENALDQIDSDGLQAASETAEAEVRALQEEFARIDVHLQRDFAPYLESQINEWRDRWGDRLRRLARFRGREFSLFNIPSPKPMPPGRFQTIARQAQAARRRLIERLANEYARIVNEASDAVEMDRRQARYLVASMLSSYEDTGGELDVTLFSDNDVELPDESDTTTGQPADGADGGSDDEAGDDDVD